MRLIPVIAMTLLAAAAAPAWELVGNLGRVKTVYVEPARIKDKEVLAAAVAALLEKFGKEQPIEINFFDDKVLTPTTLPFSPPSRPHHRAKFNLNPAKNLQKFVWVIPPDPNGPGGKPQYVEDELRLP